MRLKLFRAADMAEALAQARATLGPDALILDSRRIAGGVELTAALDPAEPAAPALPPVPPLPERPACRPAAPAADDGPARVLAYHGVPAALRAALEHAAGTLGTLEQALAARIGFAPLSWARPLLLAGPPGAGKTLTAARLATRLVLSGLRPLVITADGRRAGAAEQLAAYTRLLGLDLIVADTPALLARALARRGPGAPVLIDGWGIDPLAEADIAALRALAEAAGAGLVAVLPAGADPDEAAEHAAALHAAGARVGVATRLDLARRLGAVLAAAAILPLAEAGLGPGAADGLVPATPALLAARLRRGPAPNGRAA